VHTTASDGRSEPADLVAQAARAGITTLGITDHDTVAAVPAVAALAAGAGIAIVPGIEITAMWRGIDVHVLGYFIDIGSAVLSAFLARQRADRVDRLRLMAARLAEMGSPVDISALLDGPRAAGPHAIGRPHLARALIEAGHAADVGDAFERFLRSGAPAFIPRRGPTPLDAVLAIAEAGGLSSLAHPASLGHDELIPDLAGGGLDAIEAWHPDHSPSVVERYCRLAREYGLALTGGSDFHGDPAHGAPSLGAVLLPAGEYAVLTGRKLGRTRHGDRHQP
jgi:hypothetical protein